MNDETDPAIQTATLNPPIARYLRQVERRSRWRDTLASWTYLLTFGVAVLVDVGLLCLGFMGSLRVIHFVCR